MRKGRDKLRGASHEQTCERQACCPGQEGGVLSGQGWELTCPGAGSGVVASVCRGWLPELPGPVSRPA